MSCYGQKARAGEKEVIKLPELAIHVVGYECMYEFGDTL